MGTIVTVLKKFDIMRDIYGSLLILRSWFKYWRKSPPYKDFVDKLGDKKSSSFRIFFTQVEKLRRSEIQTMGINLSTFEKAEDDGKTWIKFLNDFGLNHESTVLDYGCGSLRLGKSMVEYLNQGNYVGVDISDHFYELGIQNYLTEEKKEEKMAEFYVIDSDQFKLKLDKRRFNIIYSQWVMMHVSPEELPLYFDNVLSLLDEGGQFFFDFTHSVVTLKQNALTWGYPSRKIFSLIRERGYKHERIIGNLYRVTKA